MRLPIHIWNGQAATGSCLFFPLLLHPALGFVPLPWFPAEFHFSYWSCCCYCYRVPLFWLSSLIFSLRHMFFAFPLRDLLSPLTLVLHTAPHLISLFLTVFFSSSQPPCWRVLSPLTGKLRWLSHLGSGFFRPVVVRNARHCHVWLRSGEEGS